MTDTCEKHDDVEAYVLQALDAAETKRFAAHLSECRSCQREVASYLPVLQALRDITLPPAPALNSRAASNVVPFRNPVRLTAAAAVILAIGGIGGFGLQNMRNNDMLTVAEMEMTSSANIALHGNGVRGHAIVGELRRRTAFVVTGLPAPTPDRDYQVWITTQGTPVSAGLLHRSPQGYEILVVPGDMLNGARRVTVTLEAAGGSERMNGAAIASGEAV